MLASLRGTVSGHLENRTLIEVNNIGYWVQTGSWQPEGEVLCYLHQHLREDASDLYGFADLQSLSLFEKLIGVSGIGPKAGLALLALGAPGDIIRAIKYEDAAFLSAAAGVGQKAAQKIILELKNKLDDTGILPGSLISPVPKENEDVLAALEGLGYRRAEIAQVLNKLPKEMTGSDAKIKWALQQL